jgi:hypothetical protein
VERGWSGANEHYTQQNSNIDYSIVFKKMFTTAKRSAISDLRKELFSKWDYLEKYTLHCLLLGYYCKPVLESADENVYFSKTKRHMGFKKKTVDRM